MFYKQELITPTFAEHLLSTQQKNRPLKTHWVAEIANDMLNNRYTEQPDPICISVSGHLKSGQHRLHAVIQSGCTIPMWLAYDVPEDAVIDKGIQRSTGDSLYMRGILDKELSSRAVIALVNRYFSITGEYYKASDSYKAEFILANKENILKTISISRRGTHSTQLCKKAGVQTAIFAALNAGIEDEKLIEFSEIVNSGFASDPKQYSAILLRNYIIENPMTGSVAADNLSAYAEMAIKDFVLGVPRKRRYNKLEHIYIKHI